MGGISKLFGLGSKPKLSAEDERIMVEKILKGRLTENFSSARLFSNEFVLLIKDSFKSGKKSSHWIGIGYIQPSEDSEPGVDVEDAEKLRAVGYNAKNEAVLVGIFSSLDQANYSVLGQYVNRLEKKQSKQEVLLEGNPVTPDIVEGILPKYRRRYSSVKYKTALRGILFNLGSETGDKMSHWQKAGFITPSDGEESTDVDSCDSVTANSYDIRGRLYIVGTYKTIDDATHAIVLHHRKVSGL